tara:strand:- start:14787 stop:15794 length:1008 start_codon:yes stop_codon:yes gene_type:complete
LQITVSIIIPHLKGKTNLSECIQSIDKKKNYEIIIVDNSSSDNSINYVKNKFPEVNIIKSKYNRGYAGGCNLGAKYAKGEYLFFLNDDTILTKNTTEILLSILKENKQVASVQPKILNYFNKNYFDYAGASGGYIDYLGYPFARGRIFNEIEEDNNQYNDKKKIFWASGTAFMTKKLIFNKINKFDEKLFAHMEEVDYHWKSILYGYDVYVEPKATIYHKGAQTLKYGSFKKTYLNHRNSMILLLTNNLSLTKLNFAKRLFLELVAIFYYIFKFDFKSGFAVLSANFWLLFNVQYILKRKSNIKKNAKIKDSDLILNKSIVWKYFIKNIKTFNKI